MGQTLYVRRALVSVSYMVSIGLVTRPLCRDKRDIATYFGKGYVEQT